MSTGFSFDRKTKEWSPGQFTLKKSKYIVKRDSPTSWVVVTHGEDFPFAWCDKDFSDAGFLRCSGVEQFEMNRKNLRFMNSYLFGYVQDRLGLKSFQNEGENTPRLEIGQCSVVSQ
jgi:hypothetical protein